MRSDRQTARNIRIGLFVASSLVILMSVLFFIGSEQRIFSKKNEYAVRLESASGLAEGNPVKLSGVIVGVVKDITLPRDPRHSYVDITVQVQRKFAERIRADSRVRLKRIGLLAADSYIDITPGTPAFAVIEAGSIIPAQRQTSVDALISSGEGAVDNLVQISYSLKDILARVDRGEGLLGELTMQPAGKPRLTDTILTTLGSTNALLSRMQSGKGLVGRLIYDEAYSDRLTTSLDSSAQSLQAILTNVRQSLETRSGAIPVLLSDPDGRRKVVSLVDNLQLTSERLASFSEGLQSGQGMLPRLVNDKPYADQTLSEFQSLVGRLNQTVTRLNTGEGTAGKLINDPSVYESINDILIGINESRMLRWLVRSRQQKGIEKRYKTEHEKGDDRLAGEPRPAAQPSSVISPPAQASPPPLPPPILQTPAAPPAPQQLPESTTTSTSDPPAAATTTDQHP